MFLFLYFMGGLFKTTVLFPYALSVWSSVFILNVSQQEFGLYSFQMEASIMIAVFGLAAQGK